MNAIELYRKQKLENYKKQLIEDRKNHGEIGKFSDKEFKSSMRDVRSRVRKAKGTKFSTNRLWNHNHIPMKSTHEIVIGKEIKSITVNGKKYVKLNK